MSDQDETTIDGAAGAEGGAEGGTEGGRERYHHGALREALLDAAEAELRERGIEGFSLRSVAKRAGVSHAAPAHHFGGTNGLLTALAAEGFKRFVDYQRARRAAAGGDAKAQLAAAGLAYVAFAEEHTALFRLMFSSDRPDCDDALLSSASLAAFADLTGLVQDVTGRTAPESADMQRDVLTVWGLSHGLADLMTSGQMFGLKALPKAEREQVLADIFARAVRT